jgi:hypothetical protein
VVFTDGHHFSLTGPQSLDEAAGAFERPTPLRTVHDWRPALRADPLDPGHRRPHDRHRPGGTAGAWPVGSAALLRFARYDHDPCRGGRQDPAAFGEVARSPLPDGDRRAEQGGGFVWRSVVPAVTAGLS